MRTLDDILAEMDSEQRQRVFELFAQLLDEERRHYRRMMRRKLRRYAVGYARQERRAQ